MVTKSSPLNESDIFKNRKMSLDKLWELPTKITDILEAHASAEGWVLPEGVPQGGPDL